MLERFLVVTEKLSDRKIALTMVTFMMTEFLSMRQSESVYGWLANASSGIISEDSDLLH